MKEIWKDITYKGIKFNVCNDGTVIRKGYYKEDIASNQYKKNYIRKTYVKDKIVNFRDNGNGYLQSCVSILNNRIIIYIL